MKSVKKIGQFLHRRRMDRWEGMSDWWRVHLEGIRPRWSHVVADGVAILSILLISNLLFSHGGWGWMGLNPSPYLLLPMVLGVRYGFWSGVGGGGVVVVAMVLFYQLEGDAGLIAFLEVNRYWLSAFVLAGGFCGEVQGILAKRYAQRGLLLEQANRKLYQLDADVYLLREGKDELERKLAMMDAEVATMDFEIRRLYQCEDGEVFSNLLSLLNRKVRVQEGAFYEVDGEGGGCRRLAYLGSGSEFPEYLNQGESSLVDLAILRGDVVSVREVWEDRKLQKCGYILATPLKDGEGRVFSVFVVSRIPFWELNKRSIHSIHLICRWASRLLSERSESDGDFRFVGKSSSQRVYGERRLQKVLKLAVETWRHLQLPSSVVVFRNGERGEEEQRKFEEVLMPFFRYGDLPARLDVEEVHLVLFLTLTGERGAVLCRDRVVKISSNAKFGMNQSVSGEVFLVDHYQEAKELMDDLRVKCQGGEKEEIRVGEL